MSRKEKEKRIEEIKEKMFILEMADRLDFEAYDKYQEELKKIEKE